MNELDEAIGEAQARSITLEAEPVLIRLLSDAALHLLESIAKTAEPTKEVASQVVTQGGIAGAFLNNISAEVLGISALEALHPIVQSIIIVRTDDIGVEGKEIVEKRILLILPFSIA